MKIGFSSDSFQSPLVIQQRQNKCEINALKSFKRKTVHICDGNFCHLDGAAGESADRPRGVQVINCSVRPGICATKSDPLLRGRVVDLQMRTNLIRSDEVDEKYYWPIWTDLTIFSSNLFPSLTLISSVEMRRITGQFEQISRSLVPVLSCSHPLP